MTRTEAIERALQASYQAVGLTGNEVACGRYRRAIEAAIVQFAADGWLVTPAPASRCTLTELLTTECAHCRPKPPPTPAERRNLGPWFAASYGGACSECGAEFAPGDLIRADGGGGWLASCCGADDQGDDLASLIAPPEGR
jgi:hypothetical protein